MYQSISCIDNNYIFVEIFQSMKNLLLLFFVCSLLFAQNIPVTKKSTIDFRKT
jgi:hypothetical protein